MAMTPQEIEEHLERIAAFLRAECEANKDDPLIVSLLQRVENRIVDLMQEVNSDGQ